MLLLGAIEGASSRRCIHDVQEWLFICNVQHVAILLLLLAGPGGAPWGGGGAPAEHVGPSGGGGGGGGAGPPPANGVLGGGAGSCGARGRCSCWAKQQLYRLCEMSDQMHIPVGPVGAQAMVGWEFNPYAPSASGSP